MHKRKYVFAQLLGFINKDVFLRLANKYDSNRYVKQYTCWNQLAVPMIGQLSNRESLPDIVLGKLTMAIMQKKMNIERSIYEMLLIVSIPLTDTINMNNLFANLTTILSMNLMVIPN